MPLLCYWPFPALEGGPDLQKPIILSYPISKTSMIWFMMAETQSAPIKPVEKIPRISGEKRRVSLLLEKEAHSLWSVWREDTRNWMVLSLVEQNTWNCPWAAIGGLKMLWEAERKYRKEWRSAWWHWIKLYLKLVLPRPYSDANLYTPSSSSQLELEFLHCQWKDF